MRYSMSANRIITIFKLMALCLVPLFIDNAYAELTANANHDQIKIDFFYHGSTIALGGVSDPKTDLIIKISSQEGHQVMREKGKVGGFLWMNVGELKLEHVPAMYFIHSTKKIEDIITPEDMNKYVLGYSALERHVEMNPISNDAEKTKWFREFVKFKEASKLYNTSSGNIEFTNKDGKQNYYILRQWPFQAPPGNYTVTVYAVKDKKITEIATKNILVEQVGLVKSLATMARSNGALYGIISILAALAAGFGVGIIFRKSGGAH